MSPSDVEAYIIVMKKHGIQNLQVEFDGTKLVVSGVYLDAQPLDPELDKDSTRRALDELED